MKGCVVTRKIPVLTALIALLSQPLLAQEAPVLTVTGSPEGAVIPLGDDPEGVVGVVVSSNFRLISAGSCDGDPCLRPCLSEGRSAGRQRQHSGQA